MAGLIGKKVGMTQIFDDEGRVVPVTVVEAGPCPVVQVKTTETDGYSAVQLGFGAQKDIRASKAEKGHAGKAGVEAAPRLVNDIDIQTRQRLAQHQTPDVVGVEAVDILGRQDALGDPVLIDLIGERHLHENAVDLLAGVQRFHELEDLLGGGAAGVRGRGRSTPCSAR